MKHHSPSTQDTPVIYVEVNGKRYKVCEEVVVSPKKMEIGKTYLESLVEIKTELDTIQSTFCQNDRVVEFLSMYTHDDSEVCPEETPEIMEEPSDERVESVVHEYPTIRAKVKDESILPVSIRYVKQPEIKGVLQNKRGEVNLTDMNGLVMITTAFGSPSGAAHAVASAMGQTIDAHSGWSQWEYYCEESKQYVRIGALKRNNFKKPRA